MRLKKDDSYYSSIVQDGNAGREFKRVHPYWQQDPNKKIFLDSSEPFTDPSSTLREAINQFVDTGDVILSTPLQARFFIEAGHSVVDVFDISLGQLLTHKLKDALQGDTREYWWIDIFDKQMLEEVFRESKFSVLYVSNIIEWASDKFELQVVADVVNNSSIRVIMFSIINTINSSNSQYFIRLMEEKRWKKKTLSNEKGESIVTFIR